jgi:hypothetical protein
MNPTSDATLTNARSLELLATSRSNEARSMTLYHPQQIIMRATECLLQSLWSSFFAILSWDEASWLGAALFLLEMEWEGEGQKQSPTQCKYTHTNEWRTSPLNLSCQNYADNSPPLIIDVLYPITNRITSKTRAWEVGTTPAFAHIST